MWAEVNDVKEMKTMSVKIQNHIKIQCPCGKFFKNPAHLQNRGLGKYCCHKHYLQYRDYSMKKTQVCNSCSRIFLTKLGCVYCRKVVKKDKI
jgi:hypothetical protein